MQVFTKIIVLLALCALAFAEGDSIRSRQLKSVKTAKSPKDAKRARDRQLKSAKSEKTPKTDKAGRYLAEKDAKTAKSPKGKKAE